MTTAEPPQTLSLIDEPSIGVDELPALDDDRELPCEGMVNVGGNTLATCRWAPCEDAAEWIVHATFPCGHQPPITLHFCCWHKWAARYGGCDRTMSDGYMCNERVTVTWIEALR